MLGPFDVKVSAVENYNQWEQLYAANPDAIALIGLCAPDIASLGKLNAANGDKFVAGGYDLTEREPRRDQGRPRLCHARPERLRAGLSAGRAAGQRDQGEEGAAGPGFYNSGTQIVTADSVDMGNGLPAVTYDQAQEWPPIRRPPPHTTSRGRRASRRHAQRGAGSRSRPNPSSCCRSNSDTKGDRRSPFAA